MVALYGDSSLVEEDILDPMFRSACYGYLHSWHRDQLASLSICQAMADVTWSWTGWDPYLGPH